MRDQSVANRWDTAVLGKLLTTGDAARVLHVSAESVRQFVRARQLCLYACTRSGLRLFLERDVRQLAHDRIDAPLFTVRPASMPRPGKDGEARQQRLFGVQLRMVKALSPSRTRLRILNRKAAGS